MNIKMVIMALGLFMIVSCHQKREQDSPSVTEPTQAQQNLLDNGWTLETPNEDLTEEYGIKPVYGIQDNYFDITMGSGCNVAIKIMDYKTDKCIRYVYVAENTTITIQEIPQGVYYLKLAYGYDWMELKTDEKTLGKFTRNVSYERSLDVFDFGVKNSRNEVSKHLHINVVNSHLENDFLTTIIDEEEFMK